MRNKRKIKIDCRPKTAPNGCPGIFPHKKCINPEIQLNNPGEISCEGVLSGVLMCDMQPVIGEIVNLSTSFPGLTFTNPTPVTDRNGSFSTTVVIEPGTTIQNGVTITAKATVIGKMVIDTISVVVECVVCTNPMVTLDPSSETVGCGGATLTGRVSCDEGAVKGTQVTFTTETTSGDVLIIPNPTVTQADGTYSAHIVPILGTVGTATIQASVDVGGQKASSTPINIEVDCQRCENPVIQLDNPGPISCEALITGRVSCDGAPVPNILVSLTSPSDILIFTNPIVFTGPTGEFSSMVTVPPGTPVQEGVEYTAKATVHGESVSNTNLVRAGCVTCTNPTLTLNTPGNVVGCDGAQITGVLECDEGPIENEPVFFTISSVSEDVFLDHNPAITKEDGSFSTGLVIGEDGIDETITITASSVVGGEQVTAGPNSVIVDCPAQECTCKFRLDTQGKPQPGANIRVTRFGRPIDLKGTLNINVLQCGSSAGGGCNPAIDNFNFSFNANNGVNFQFIRGRRTMISCNEEETVAMLEGEIQGRINNGPPRTFEATITATLNATTDVITWEIFADDLTTTTIETIVPFVAQGSPQTFIVTCP